MAIATAFVSGGAILVYDEKGRQLCWIHPHNGLLGYTSSTVSVLSGSNVRVYDEHANFLFSVYRGPVSSGGVSSGNLVQRNLIGT